MGFHVPLWRAIAVFRIASLVYAAALVLQHYEELKRPALGWAVIVVMAAWTVATAYLYSTARWRRWPLVGIDFAAALGCLLATEIAGTDAYLASAPPLTATWIAGPVLAAAVMGGRRWAVASALLYGLADAVMRGGVHQSVVNGIVLMLLAGFAVGYMASIATDAEERFGRAVEIEARTRERERLARSIHDSVLQVLAMVQRRGSELGGEAAELGRLAGEQEAALRGLIGTADSGTAPAPDAAPGSSPPAAYGGMDLRSVLNAHAASLVTVSSPATEVRMAPQACREIDAAVRAALANVERHCPAHTRTWLLIEDEGDAVLVSVRDDGPGIPEGRLGAAERDGRLGVAQSIRGRLRDLGGDVAISTGPEGTELELRAPRG